MRDRALAIARRNARIRSVVLITAADPRPPSLGWDVFVPDLKVDSRVAPGPDAALRLDPIDRKTALVAESRPWIVASVPASYGEALRLFFGRAGVGAFPKRSGAFDAVAPPCAQSVKGKLFAKSYKARYEKEPNLGYAYQTYAALQVMADTAKAFPPRLHDAATFADFIRMSPFRTILGEIRFWKGDATWRSDSLWHVDYGDVRSEPKCVDDPATLLDLLPRLGGG